ncbi:hypothetical protein SDC9_57029 [bioreactor metagenome]|uniref:Membrane transporter protein YfcA n=2 Tax=root TaxID=1 RepID=A0A644X3H5_9ZZZZ
MNPVFYLLAVIAGIITGGLTSMIGASGVMIIVPVLTMLFHVGAHTAIGTSLFVDVIASAVVSYTYFRNGNVELKSGIWIAVSSIAGAQLGSLLASQIQEGSLSALFGVILVLSGIMMFIKAYRKKQDDQEQQNRKIRFAKGWQQIVSSIVIGVGIGIISGMFGAGGGGMILLTLIAVLSYPMHKAIGTSTLIMAMTAFSSTIGYAYRGNLNLPLGCVLSVGAVIGGVIGGRYANKVNEKTLQKVVYSKYGGDIDGEGVAISYYNQSPIRQRWSSLGTKAGRKNEDAVFGSRNNKRSS